MAALVPGRHRWSDNTVTLILKTEQSSACLSALCMSIALPEMIEFLLEEWDDEGLLVHADYD